MSGILFFLFPLSYPSFYPSYFYLAQDFNYCTRAFYDSCTHDVRYVVYATCFAPICFVGLPKDGEVVILFSYTSCWWLKLKKISCKRGGTGTPSSHHYTKWDISWNFPFSQVAWSSTNWVLSYYTDSCAHSTFVCSWKEKVFHTPLVFIHLKGKEKKDIE